jgi:hypothetical protein
MEDLVEIWRKHAVDLNGAMLKPLFMRAVNDAVKNKHKKKN